MAMTKAERLRVEALEQELALERAFRLGTPVPPDVPIPSGGEEKTGYTINLFAKAIYPTRTGAVSHTRGISYGYEFPRGDDLRSQRGVPLYSTRVLALRALRYGVALEAAKHLLAIDEAIARADDQQNERVIEE